MDPITASAIIGGGFDLATNIGQNIFNAQATKKQNIINERLMRESWARDDNAIQRRVADMKAAGINPILAAGSAAGNSGAIRVEAPNAQFGINALDKVLTIANAKNESKIIKENAEKASAERKIAENNLVLSDDERKSHSFARSLRNSEGREVWQDEIMEAVIDREDQRNLDREEREERRRIRNTMREEGLINPNGSAAEMMQSARVFEKLLKSGISFPKLAAIAAQVLK